MDLDQVNYVEFHADTWDFGFTLWVDGVQFHDCTPLSAEAHPFAASVQLEVFPNPTEGLVNFRCFSASKATIQMHDIQGRLVWTETPHEPSSQWFILQKDLSDLPPGIYTIRLISGDRMVQKILVAR